MPESILLIDDNAPYRKLLRKALAKEGYQVLEAGDAETALEVIRRAPVDVIVADVVLPGMDGIELIERARAIQPQLLAIVMTGHRTNERVAAALRNKACDLLLKPFEFEDLKAAVQSALGRREACQFEVISATPNWIEIRVPCDLRAVEPIGNFITELECNLPRETREAIGEAFREMLSNAIEHGGKCDPTQRVDIKWIRLKHAILYSIKDPGEGFDITSIEHAAVGNPAGEPLRHLKVREEKGLRPGGFGIMLASQAIDELIYNEKHNELILVKYVEEENEGVEG